MAWYRGVLIVGVVGGSTLLSLPAPALATGDQALNGAYRAFSDGEWSKTNGRYEDQASVTATWSISSTCSNYLDCTGTVSSDEGWTADLVYQSGIWRLELSVDRWLACEDGTSFQGQRTVLFWPESANPTRLVGFDKTLGPGGACGTNRPVTVDMPITLTPT